jgi:acid stress-induced BolA-like protein IbaG/YrbA
MIIEEIKRALSTFPDLMHMNIEGDGQHFEITMVSSAFLEKTKLARQRLVYQYLNQMITDGRLHAVVLMTFTPDEWDKNE